MERELDLAEVSDGRLYTSGDMVKIGCNDCAGCSECCRVVEDTIILDPYDIWQLERHLAADFEALMESRIRLSVVDGIIQPHLYVRPNGAGCTFLGADGRCGIHESRPGFCRMFPMGRIYEDGDFRYFLQVHECPREPKAKIKVKRWLGIPELKRYEQFICDWHFYLKELRKKVEEAPELIREISLELLKRFYTEPYDLQGDFYGEFYQRLREG